MAGLSLDPGSVAFDCSESVSISSGQTPTAKRQRRLTLTAMTGLISELSQERPVCAGSAAAVAANAASAAGAVANGVDGGRSCLAVVAQEECAVLRERLDDTNCQRESSPLKRLKRSRASISATATADVMAALAAKTLAASRSARWPGTRSSDSSDSVEEEEDDSLALRVRRTQAFESGTLAASETGSTALLLSPGSQHGEQSPRSKLAYERGLRAAMVAAKVAAEMMPEKSPHNTDVVATLASSPITLPIGPPPNRLPRRQGCA